MDNYKEVDFKKYCEKCEYKKLDEKFDPCCECLDTRAKRNSQIPEFYKERK